MTVTVIKPCFFLKLQMVNSVLYVRSWFCIFYEAAKPHYDLTILVAVTADPLTC